MLLLAYMVENGDLVILNGHPRRVKTIRTERQPDGRDDIVMEFGDGHPLRLGAEDTVSVRLSSRSGQLPRVRHPAHPQEAGQLTGEA